MSAQTAHSPPWRTRDDPRSDRPGCDPRADRDLVSHPAPGRPRSRRGDASSRFLRGPRPPARPVGNEAQFFATLDLAASIGTGVALSVGIRNSIDKTLPLGFCAGNRVFVCDNLSFSAELLVNRKHTVNGGARFREAIALAAGRLRVFRASEAARVGLMQATDPGRPGRGVADPAGLGSEDHLAFPAPRGAGGVAGALARGRSSPGPLEPVQRLHGGLAAVQPVEPAGVRRADVQPQSSARSAGRGAGVLRTPPRDRSRIREHGGR